MTTGSAGGAIIIETVIVITLFGLIASLSVNLSRKIKLPHSIFLVLIGIGLGIAANKASLPADLTAGTSSPLSELFYALKNFNLSAETIFFIFLPTLIFESSYNINTRQLMKDLPGILVLAVPALLVSIFFVAFSLHYIGGVEFMIALLIGAIIAATDPVAVMAIFKDLGAPKRLNLLVEGESLFNDATSIVAFSIILSILEATLSGIASSVGFFVIAMDFLRIFLGGIVTGLIVGYIFTAVLNTIKTNSVLEIILTTLIAYLSFLIAHHYLNVSGVMSTVVAGLYLGGFGRTALTYTSKEFMSEFWETISFMANSVLFLSIGLLMSHYLSFNTLMDYMPLLIISVVAVNFSRALSVHTMLPLLAKTKLIEPINFSYQTLLWWGGGLRGAIAIALSLSLLGSNIIPKEAQETVLFITFAVVMFSLIANAMTISPIIKYFGLDKPTKDETYARELALLHSKRSVINKISNLKSIKRYYPEPYNRVLTKYKNEELALLNSLKNLEGVSNLEKEAVIMREALLIEKNSYFETFTEGELSSLAMKDLQHEVDKELDRLKQNEKLFVNRFQLGRISYIEKILSAMEKITHTYTTKTLTMRFEKAKATIKSAQEVAKFLHEKEIEFTELHLSCQKILKDFMNLKKESERELAQISLNFPEYVDHVVENVIKMSSTKSEIYEIEKMYSLGQIPDVAYTTLINDLKKSMDRLTKIPPKVIDLDPELLLSKVSFFRHLDSTHLKALSKHLHFRTFLEDEVLIEEGTKGEELFFIRRGVVVVYVGHRGDNKEDYVTLATLTSGDILGEMALITDDKRRASAKALSHGTALTLHKSHFKKFLEENPDLKDKIYSVFEERQRNAGHEL